MRASIWSAGKRAAVMESLWLLDSVMTEFRGVPLPEGGVSGVFSNQIIEDLRRSPHFERSFWRAGVLPTKHKPPVQREMGPDQI
jgi:hypothetical protein